MSAPTTSSFYKTVNNVLSVFTPSKGGDGFGGNSQKYQHVSQRDSVILDGVQGAQGSQGLQGEMDAEPAEEQIYFNAKQAFGKPTAVLTEILIMIHYLAYLRYSLPVLYERCGIYAAIPFTLFITYLFVCLVYTHIKAWITEPGYPERIATATGHLMLNFEKQDTKGMSANLKSLISKRNKGFVALLNSGQANFTKYQFQCFKCVLKPLKPHRSYHCSTCERDIIYMDHHCIWANNCIGLNNYRYFLGFITYLSITLPLLVATYTLRNHLPSLKQAGADYYLFISIYSLDVVLAMMIIPYTIWNWRLAMKGITSIEYVKGFLSEDNNQQDYEDAKLAQFIRMYKIDLWRENLFIIFGTWSLFYAILKPSDRLLPLRGLEWSFMNLTNQNGSGHTPSTNGNTNKSFEIQMTNRQNRSANKRHEDTDNLL